MKQKLSYVVALAVVIASFWGCSGIQRVINTGDSELIFDRAMIYYNAEKWTKAASLLEACEYYYKGTLKEDTVSFYLARCRFKEGDYATSSMLCD